MSRVTLLLVDMFFHATAPVIYKLVRVFYGRVLSAEALGKMEVRALWVRIQSFWSSLDHTTLCQLSVEQ